MVTDLLLIRHGQAVSNVEPVIAGLHGDRGLTDLGRRQAALLEQRLRTESPHVDALYVSTLPRALETGAYVARGLGLTAVETDDLHELRPGDAADDLGIEEWRSRSEVEVPPRDPFRPFSPDGESWAAFLARAGAALEDLVARHPSQTVVAVCHQGVVEASFALAYGHDGAARRVGIDPPNTSLTHWRHRRDAGGGPLWALVAFGDARHLDG
ncbi:histidine phosphatase family protein [uncultured Nocardioides sp.]|uniref:histidine phosphatase family protein n=1 Tax=uncultured Nocardioides sp. TaxID=198441 RepID=UPI00260DE191|nr:histidine phosphatase family protein [uncultured Nocardioides sp.]